MRRILGLSAYYHDSAAALVVDGEPIAAAQEERFTRRRHDASFPARAARYCLAEAGLALGDLDAVVFYEKPFVKFERLLETYLANAPRGLRSFVAAMPIWTKEKLFQKSILRRELAAIGGGAQPPLLFSEHHLSHAAAAFYPSPFQRAAVLCLDGVGEWTTTSGWHGAGARLTPLWEQRFPHSLGLLYSAFTYYTGFKVNSGEYKMMGLAPYGEPRYADTIREHLVDVKPDGSFRLDMRYFDFATGLRMTGRRFHELFGGPPRAPESPLDQRTADLARSVQVVTEDIMLAMARALHAETGEPNLCLAGGVALNCVANARVLREGPFADVWIQPAAGDAGGALGAALYAWYSSAGNARAAPVDAMRAARLGPAYSDAQVQQFLRAEGLPFAVVEESALIERVADLLAGGAVVGWFQGRMEFGPRALGNRSFLGDPRDAGMQRTLNLRIKSRESFRPFAPSVVASEASRYFEFDRASPYMLFVAPVRARRAAGSAPCGGILERLAQPRAPLPAVTHVDYSARLHTVERAANPRFHLLLQAFARRSGVPILINTSFNVRGEPIVCSPEDACRCFLATGADYLAIGTCLLEQKAMPAQHRLRTHGTFEPD